MTVNDVLAFVVDRLAELDEEYHTHGMNSDEYFPAVSGLIAVQRFILEGEK